MNEEVEKLTMLAEFGDDILPELQLCLDLLAKLENTKPEILNWLKIFLKKAKPSMSVGNLAKLIKATIKDKNQLGDLRHLWHNFEELSKQLAQSPILTAQPTIS